MNRSIYSYLTAFEVGLCVHKKLLCLVIHIYRYFNVSTMASSAIMLFPLSANNDGGILLHSWSPIKLLMLMSPPLTFCVLFAEEKKCHYSCQTNQFSLYTILVSGSESSHSRVTRASYNYNLQSNGSFGHHFFHIKTRSSAEHSKIANRER